MTTSETKNNGNSNGAWLRRCHRWLGATLAVFILLLSCTGIALNHSSDWNLDRSFVSSSWLLDAYGLRAPPVSASFSDGTRRATLLGKRLYLDDHEVADDIDALAGMVSLEDLVLIATGRQVLLLTSDGELVERMDLSALLPGPIERVGRAGNRAVVSAAGTSLATNADVTGFELLTDAVVVIWPENSNVPEALQEALDAQYRGRGLSIERVITDLHNGRIVIVAGPYLMDAVGILLIILSISGILMWLRPRRVRGQ